MPKQEDQQDTIQSTLHQQLLKSHLRVAGLAAIAFFLVAIAIQVLHRPITTIRSVNVPTANAAMSIQLGLQRSEASLRGFVTLKEPTLRKNLDLAWDNEITPAFELLQSLTKQQGSEDRKLQMYALATKLKRLRIHQSLTVSIATQPSNEPARLAYRRDYLPKQIEFVNKVEQRRVKLKSPSGAPHEGYLALRLAVANADAALGLLVVEGRVEDAAEFRRRFDRMRYALQNFEYLSPVIEYLSPTSESLAHHIDGLEKLADIIVESRLSSRNNTAWYNIKNSITPLAQEISDELAAIADYEVATMRDRVDHVATWANLLSVGSLMALFILLVIALILSSSAASRISNPVTQLFRATEELKNGNYKQRMRPHGVLEVQGLINAFNAMSESIMNSHQALEEIAYTDELTGLPNRKAFNNLIQQFSQSSQQNQERTGAMVIDLDYFKQVNDSLGHDAGDHLLTVFSQRLQQSLRHSDFAARIGGDEFAVLLGALENEDEAKQLAEKICAITSQPLVYQGQNIKPSSTIGLAVEETSGLDINELVKKADVALYDAKAEGRGGYCFYSTNVHEKATNTRVLAELIDNNEIGDMFRLLYQPYVDLTTEQFVGVEALLRCTHPACVGVPILDIITMLERSGHIETVSKWVLSEAIDQLKFWRETTDLSDEFTMSCQHICCSIER